MVTGTQNQSELWRGHLGGGLVTSGCKGQSAPSLTGRESGEKYPVSLSSLLHIWCGGKQKTNNYLTFLSLTFFICERGNNNIYLSGFCEIK